MSDTSSLEELQEFINISRILGEGWSMRERPHDTRTFINASCNLQSIDTWGEPEDFFKEKAYLVQYVVHRWTLCVFVLTYLWQIGKVIESTGNKESSGYRRRSLC